MSQETRAHARSTKLRTPPGALNDARTPKGRGLDRKQDPCITPRPKSPSLDTLEPADLPVEGARDAENGSSMRPAEIHLASLRVEIERLHKESDNLQKENKLLQRRLAGITTSMPKAKSDISSAETSYNSLPSLDIARKDELPSTEREPMMSITMSSGPCDRNGYHNDLLKRSLAGAQTDTADFGRTENPKAFDDNFACVPSSHKHTASLLFSKDNGSPKTREERIRKLHDWFDRIVPQGEYGLSPSQLLGILQEVHGSDAKLLSALEIECVIRSLQYEYFQNREDDMEGGLMPRNSTSSEDGELLHFPLFANLILFDRTEELLEVPEIHENAIILRDALMRQHIDDLIVHYARIPRPQKMSSKQNRAAYFIGLLDPLVAVMILMNGLTIGLSSYIEWGWWDVLEIAFAVFFLLEMLLKIFFNGFRDHFFGHDWSWNWFDAFVVLLGVIDAPFTLLVASDDKNLPAFSLVRMARLARITRMLRLVRILRLRTFKELLLMVKGVVAGLRTLLWAIVMFSAIVYVCAVVLRQTVGRDHHIMNDMYQTVLFGTVPWSMFSAFRCFMSDCNLPDGSPIAGHLYEIYGYSFVVPYSLMIMFTTFGILNMVTAVFVENVMESAQQRKLLTKESDQKRVGTLLRKLVLRLAARGGRNGCKFPSGDFASYPTVPSTWIGWIRALSDFLRNPRSRLASIVVSHEAGDRWRSTVCDLKINSEISRDTFLCAIEEPEMSRLIDDLEVNVSDRVELFDVLDCDGSGYIDIGELISGIMKLRSNETKHEIVALTLGMRGLRDTLRETGERVSHIHSLLTEYRHRQKTSMPRRFSCIM